jgi:hypothetical protein
MIAQITADLSASRRTLRPFFEMNYVLVPDTQPTQPVTFFNYPDESDLDGGRSPVGRYPIPANLPVETWPSQTGALTLSQWQQDASNIGGDRHAIIVAPGSGKLWETWLTKLNGNAWQASNGAIFNLNSNALRPAGWTSADAAGLPMFAALVRYDECQRGTIEHALRLVVKRTRVGPIYPATHSASVGSTTNPDIPAMGERLRLNAAFVIPSTWTGEEKAVLAALKKYGAIVADNGGFFSISICPDDRFTPGVFDHLSTVSISNFEVIKTTGLNEGPRSPGAPLVDAGLDQAVKFDATASLRGVVVSSNNPVIHWKKISGPGSVTFTDAAQVATFASFSMPGRYTLLFAADDAVHASAYDAVVIDVVFAIDPRHSGSDCHLQFPTVVGRFYRVESSPDMAPGSWTLLAGPLAGTGGMMEIVDSNVIGAARRFYRAVVVE